MRQLPDDPPCQIDEDIELDGRIDGIDFLTESVSQEDEDNSSRVEE